MADVKIDTELEPMVDELNNKFKELKLSILDTSKGVSKFNDSLDENSLKEFMGNLEKIGGILSSLEDSLGSVSDEVKMNIDFSDLKKLDNDISGILKKFKKNVGKIDTSSFFSYDPEKGFSKGGNKEKLKNTALGYADDIEKEFKKKYISLDSLKPRDYDERKANEARLKEEEKLAKKRKEIEETNRPIIQKQELANEGKKLDLKTKQLELELKNQSTSKESLKLRQMEINAEEKARKDEQKLTQMRNQAKKQSDESKIKLQEIKEAGKALAQEKQLSIEAQKEATAKEQTHTQEQAILKIEKQRQAAESKHELDMQALRAKNASVKEIEANKTIELAKRAETQKTNNIELENLKHRQALEREAAKTAEQNKRAETQKTNNIELENLKHRQALEREAAKTAEHAKRTDYNKKARLDEEQRKKTAHENERKSYANEAVNVLSLENQINEALKSLQKMKDSGTIFEDDWTKAILNITELIDKLEAEINGLTNETLKWSATKVVSEAKTKMGSLSSSGTTHIGGTKADHDATQKFLKERKEAWSKVGSYAKGVIDGWWSIEKKMIKWTYSGYRSMFKGIGTIMSKTWNIFHKNGNSTIDALKRQLGTLVGYFSLYQVFNTGKDAIEFSSDMVETRNVVQGVFRDSSSEIQDFAKTAISSFGLTELQATKMTGIFGGILTSSGVAADRVTLMSKNLTALAGDIASFYNLSQDESFKKLTSAITGETEAIRSLGVNMTVANLEAYALSQGITEQWRNLDYATQQTLRYNYIMQQLAVTQGDFARTSGTWANQVRLLSSNWQQFLSIMGGAVIKVFYPVVVVLNQILSLAIQAAKSLASIFGFDYTSLEKQFGTGASVETPELENTDLSIDTGGIEDYAKATDDAASATDNLSKSTEEAGSNLQSFDKLNNITTEDTEARTEALKDAGKGDLSGLGKSKFDIEPVNPLEDVKNPTVEVNQWLQDWIKLLKDKKWFEAGKMLSNKIADGLDNIYDTLSSEDFKKKTKSFASGVGEFINGFTSDARLFVSTGKVLGAGTNTITSALNTFFDTVDWNTMGKNANAGFKAMLTEIDAKELGKALVNPFFAGIQFLDGLIQDPTIFDDLGKKLGDGINGAIERIDLAHSIPTLASFLGGLIKTLGTTAETVDWSALATGLQTGLDTAIENWNPAESGQALSSVLDGLAKLLQGAADADWGTAGDKLGETINTAVENGTARNMSKAMTSIALKLLVMLGNAFKEVDKTELVNELIGGIKDAFGDLSEDDFTTAIQVLSVLFSGILLKGVIKGCTMIKGTAEFINAIKGLFSAKGVSSGIEATMSTTAKTGILSGLKGAVAGIGAVEVGAILAPIAVAVGGVALYNKNQEDYTKALQDSENIKNKYLDMASGLQDINLGLSADTNIDSWMKLETTANNILRTYSQIPEEIRQAGINTDDIFGTWNDFHLKIDEVYDSAKNFREEVKSAGFTELESYKELSKLLNSYSEDFNTNEGRRWSENVSKQMSLIADEIGHGSDAIRNQIMLDGDPFAEQVDTYLASLKTKGKEGGKSLKQGVDEGVKEATALGEDAVSSLIGKNPEEVTAEGIANGTAYAQGVLQGIATATEGQEAVFNQLLPTVVDDFSSKGIDCAVEFVDSVSVSMGALQQSIDSAIAEVANNIYVDNVHRFVLAAQQLAEAFNSTISANIDTTPTHRGSSNVITRRNVSFAGSLFRSRFGTPTGNIGGSADSYSNVSAYARTLPSIEPLALNSEKFSRYYAEPNVYSNLGVYSGFTPTNSLITPSQYASNTQASRALSLDPELMNLLRGMSTRLNSLRNNGASSVDVSVTLGNKQFDNYILDVVRRNGYSRNK